MYSKDIPEVLLPLLLVVPNLIMVYLLLVMEPKVVKDISLLKIHGVLIGVMMVMSKSLIVHPTFVVSYLNLLIQQNDLNFDYITINLSLNILHVMYNIIICF